MIGNEFRIIFTCFMTRKGRAACKGDIKVSCINGGTCALYVSEDATMCVQRCK